MRCIVFTVVASILLSPVVTLLFGVSLLPFSWPYLAAIPVMLLIMIPLAHSGMLGSWWRTLPPLRATWRLLASFVVLSAAAAAIGSLTTPAALAVCALVGLVNARAWYGVAAAVSRRRCQPMTLWARRRHLHWPVLPAPVSPVAAAVALALARRGDSAIFVVAGTTPLAGGAGRRANKSGNHGRQLRAGRRPRRGKLTSAVLVIPGFGSSCCYPSESRNLIGPSALVRPFSYAGLGAGGRPLPYGLDATDLPLSVLGDRIAQQVWKLHRETGLPVDIVAESEGTLGANAMLARHPDVPVRSVVLLSPIVDPGQADQGDRAAAPSGSGDPVLGDALTQLVKVAGALSPFGSSGAQRLIGSVRSDGAAYAAAAVKNGQKIRWLAVVPLADAVTLPVRDLPGNVIVVSALHGSLLGDYGVDRMAHRFLVHEDVAGTQQLRDTAQVIAAAAAAWRMPVIGSSNTSCTK